MILAYHSGGRWAGNPFPSGWAGAAACLGLALAIFAVEIGLAHLWLRRFRTGPLEHLWRRLVYLRRAPFLR